MFQKRRKVDNAKMMPASKVSNFWYIYYMYSNNILINGSLGEKLICSVSNFFYNSLEAMVNFQNERELFPPW